MKLHLVSLGCARNLVDSEIMLGRLFKANWTFSQDPAGADVIIVNTCSFIESAAEESIDTVLEMAALKKQGTCRRLIVAGCLPERFRENITDALPEVDVFLGTGAYDKIIQAAEGTLDETSTCILPDPDLTELQHQAVPRATSDHYMAYIKIAEGCSKHCTYCIIPKLRGKHRSRPIDDIVSEAGSLILSGKKELVLIAQDTTFFGKDRHPAVGLDILLERISKISDDIRIRFLYGHPESIEKAIIQTVAAYPNICSYFDIPIQHASTAVLKKMGRHYTRDDLYDLFDTIRKTVPDASLRTTVITGFPGETDEDVRTLLDFIKEVRFDHLGVFTYSDSEDLPAHQLPNPVDNDTASDRYDILMAHQAEISLSNNRKKIGNTVRVLVEEGLEKNFLKGRTAFQAPEVDGVTYIENCFEPENIPVGNFLNVKVTDATEYDLIGVPL